MPLAEPKTSTRNADYTPIEPPIPCQFDRFGKLTIGQIVSENSDYYTVEFENGAEARYPKKNVTRLDPESLLAMPLAQRPRSIESLPINTLIRDRGTQHRVNGIDQSTVEAYVEVIQSGGKLEYLDVVRTPQGDDILWDGNQRIEALQICDIPEYECRVVFGTIEDALNLSYGANAGHGLRRSNADKRNATIAAWLAPHNKGLQPPAIAALCKVSVVYAGKIRKLPEIVDALGPEPDSVTVTRNGTTYEMKKPQRAAVEPEIEESADDRVWVETAEGTDEYRAYTPEHSIEQPIPKRFGMQAEISGDDFEEPDLDDLEIPEPEVLLAASKGKASNEKYTPPVWADFAREVFGGSIELDPASCPEANQVIKARRIYTIEDNALSQSWKCKTLFLNPPYSMPEVEEFAFKFLAEVSEDSIGDAIILVNACTETAWFQALANECHLLLFPNTRINFWAPGTDPKNIKGSNEYRQCLLYRGGNVDRFKSLGQELGLVVEVCK